MIKIGAHVSAAGGITKAVEKAQLIGAEYIQIFASPPQSFNPPNHSPQMIEEFLSQTKALGIGPNFIHAIYLTNLASPRPELVERSVTSLSQALAFADQAGIEGVIFHTGSALSADFNAVKEQVVQAIKKILMTQGKSKLIIENSAGQGGTIGARFDQIGALIKEVNSSRFKACLDTQHAFAMGYDLRVQKGIEKMLSEWDKEVGIEHLVCLHVNDSKTPLGSNRDRHENIGEGEIGLAGFKLMKKNPVLQKLPWILEVPGYEKKGPDKRNIDTLRSI